eukprot:12734125-Heterocapsa_arctica.AAC.1
MEVGASGHTMIDVADYDENTLLPRKFTNNYDEQFVEPDELLQRELHRREGDHAIAEIRRVAVA